MEQAKKVSKEHLLFIRMWPRDGGSNGRVQGLMVIVCDRFKVEDQITSTEAVKEVRGQTRNT